MMMYCKYQHLSQMYHVSSCHRYLCRRIMYIYINMYIDQRNLGNFFGKSSCTAMGARKSQKTPQRFDRETPERNKTQKGAFSDFWRAGNDPKLDPRFILHHESCGNFLILYSFEHVLLKASEIFHCLSEKICWGVSHRFGTKTP